MDADTDDEALNWGDADPTHIDAPVGATVEGDPPTGGPRTSSAVLVTYGIFCGAYVLFIAGWIIAVTRDTFVQGSLLTEIMYQLGEFLAIASPAIWMGTVLVLTRDSKPAIRMLWLAMGLLVVAPWPFILRGLA